MEKIVYGANVGHVKRRVPKSIPKKIKNIKLPKIYGANMLQSKLVVEIPSTPVETKQPEPESEPIVQEEETPKAENWKAKREKRKQLPPTE